MAKTKVEIKGVREVSNNLKSFIKSIGQDEALLVELGKEATQQIKRQTQARLDEYKQPDLKKSTKERRKSLIKSGNTSEFTKDTRSNLSLSGQLLNAIRFEVNAARSLISIYLNPNRRKYIGVKGTPIGEDKTNVQIKSDLEKKRFRFLFISKKLEAILQSKTISAIRRKLSQYNKLKRFLK